jgi:two-component system nitrate/nitrite response regulator NarL
MSDRSKAQCAILIASPDARVRRRWKQELKDMFAICEVGNFTELQANIARLKPSVVLVDMALSNLKGSSGLKTIGRLSTTSKMIALTSIPDEREEVLVLESGARGYCNSDIDPILLKKAVQMVQKGEIWVGRSMISTLVKKLLLRNQNLQQSSRIKAVQLKSLTPREREVASLVGGGASNKEIASQLRISEATVKAHMTEIFQRLGISDRLQLALYVTGKNHTVLLFFVFIIYFVITKA